MKSTLVTIFFTLISAAALADCPIPSASPQYRSESNNIEQYYWVLDQAQAWLDPADTPLDSFVDSYQDVVRSHTELDQKGLIRKQQAVYRNAFGSDHSSVLQMQAILDNQAVSIVKSSCLDQLLLSGQLQRVDMVNNPTEFAAHVFKRDDHLRVYVAWRTQASFSGPHVDISARRIRNLIDSGWSYEYHLHNHPFAFFNRYGDIAGTITASTPDLNTYDFFFRSYPMNYGRITNGIDSGIYLEEDVDYLRRLD